MLAALGSLRRTVRTSLLQSLHASAPRPRRAMPLRHRTSQGGPCGISTSDVLAMPLGRRELCVSVPPFLRFSVSPFLRSAPLYLISSPLPSPPRSRPPPPPPPLPLLSAVWLVGKATPYFTQSLSRHRARAVSQLRVVAFSFAPTQTRPNPDHVRTAGQSHQCRKQPVISHRRGHRQPRQPTFAHPHTRYSHLPGTTARSLFLWTASHIPLPGEPSQIRYTHAHAHTLPTGLPLPISGGLPRRDTRSSRSLPI